jgi:hypothetical protein
MLVTVFAPRAEADFSPSRSMACPTVDRAHDMGRIQTVLETKTVRARLTDLGFTPFEIAERLSRMTDSQLHSVATSLEETKTGGAAEGVLIGVMVIVLVVLVILPLLGIRVWR